MSDVDTSLGLPLPASVSPEDFATAFEQALSRGVIVEAQDEPMEPAEQVAEEATEPAEASTEVASATEAATELAETLELAPTAEAPATDPIVPQPAVYTVPGIPVQLREEDVRLLWSVGQQLSSVTPEQAQQIDAILSGRPLPTPTAPAPSSTTDDDDLLDPATAQRIAALEARLVAAEQRAAIPQQQAAQYQVAQDTARHNQISGDVAQEYATRYGLSVDEVQQTWQIAAQNGVMANAARRHGPNLEAAYRETFQAGMLANPALADKIIEKRVQDRLAQQTNDDKKAKAAAATGGGGGSIPRVAPPLPKVNPNATVAELSSGLAKQLERFMQQ